MHLTNLLIHSLLINKEFPGPHSTNLLIHSLHLTDVWSNFEAVNLQSWKFCHPATNPPNCKSLSFFQARPSILAFHVSCKIQAFKDASEILYRKRFDLSLLDALPRWHGFWYFWNIEYVTFWCTNLFLFIFLFSGMGLQILFQNLNH